VKTDVVILLVGEYWCFEGIFCCHLHSGHYTVFRSEELQHCAAHQIFFVQSNEEEWGGRGRENTSADGVLVGYPKVRR
jgi:hypothetical protein